MLLDRGEYKPFTLEESISIVKKLLVLFYVNNINVIKYRCVWLSPRHRAQGRRHGGRTYR